jgi:hypothetical protein
MRMFAAAVPAQKDIAAVQAGGKSLTAGQVAQA